MVNLFDYIGVISYVDESTLSYFGVLYILLFVCLFIFILLRTVIRSDIFMLSVLVIPILYIIFMLPESSSSVLFVVFLILCLYFFKKGDYIGSTPINAPDYASSNPRNPNKGPKNWWEKYWNKFKDYMGYESDAEAKEALITGVCLVGFGVAVVYAVYKGCFVGMSGDTFPVNHDPSPISQPPSDPSPISHSPNDGPHSQPRLDLDTKQIDVESEASKPNQSSSIPEKDDKDDPIASADTKQTDVESEMSKPNQSSKRGDNDDSIASADVNLQKTSYYCDYQDDNDNDSNDSDYTDCESESDAKEIELEGAKVCMGMVREEIREIKEKLAEINATDCDTYHEIKNSLFKKQEELRFLKKRIECLEDNM